MLLWHQLSVDGTGSDCRTAAVPVTHYDFILLDWWSYPQHMIYAYLHGYGNHVSSVAYQDYCNHPRQLRDLGEEFHYSRLGWV